MDNKIPTGRVFSQNKAGQDLFKGTDGLLSTPDENFNSSNQLPQTGKELNILSVYYNKKAGNGNFMEKIGKLNKKFYNCSDRFVKSKKILEKINDELFLNLFQQINCYVEEIERLNKKLSLNNNQEYKKTIDLLNKEISEKKEKIRHFENKIKEKTLNEEKLNKEIESYKRRIIFYKDKIKIELLGRNRNSLKSLGRETSISRLDCKKKSFKNQTNCRSPTPGKNKSLLNKNNKFNKDLNIKLDEEISNKRTTIDKSKDSGEKYKKIKKAFNPKESVIVNYFQNKTEYDQDEKYNEGKDDDFHFNLENTNTNNPINAANVLSSDNILKNTSVLVNALTQELYGSPVNEARNTLGSENVNNELLDIKTNSEILSDKKSKIEEVDKNKILNRYTRGQRTNNKSKTTKQNTKNNDAIKSKIFRNINNNNRKDNSIRNENEANLNNTMKTKQAKTTTKSRPKNPNRSTDKNKISNNPEIKTPYVKKINRNNKEKDTNYNNNTILESNKKNNQNTPDVTHHKRGSAINRELEKKIKTTLNNTSEAITFSKTFKKTDTINQKNNGNYSTSNLKVVSGKEKLNNISYKKLNDKENKELHYTLISVDDDYLKSIEMLRKQEEQIKRLLEDIDLDD